MKLFEIALEAPLASDPVIWGTFHWVLGHCTDFQYSVCRAIIAFSISLSEAAKLEVPVIWDIFTPICGLKIIKQKQFAHFLQNSTQNSTESELCTHSHVYTHRDGNGVQGRCRHCPAFLGNTQWLLGGSKRKKPQNYPPRSPLPWQPLWPLPLLQLPPQIPFLPYFISFWLLHLLSSPDMLCSSHPNGAVEGCVHGSSVSLARKGSLSQCWELFWVYYWILVVLPFFFPLLCISSQLPELGRAGSNSATLPE